MKLSCLPVSLYADVTAGRMSLADWFRRAAGLGLDGADVSVINLPGRAPADLDRLRDDAGEAGVEIARLATYSDFTYPDPRERARELDDLRRWIDAGARLGVHGLRLTAGQARPDLHESDALGWVADGLVACARAAAGTGVRILYENHVRGAPWTHNDFTQSVARFREVLRRTRGAGVDVLFDTANNLVLGEPPMEVLDAAVTRLGAVHLSDIARAGAFEPTVIGTGVSPIPQLLGRIVSSGFDGWISIEEASRTGPAAFERAVAFADREWIEAGGAARRKTRQGRS
jgi:sugar phosphate isomerase/epimerase